MTTPIETLILDWAEAALAATEIRRAIARSPQGGKREGYGALDRLATFLESVTPRNYGAPGYPGQEVILTKRVAAPGLQGTRNGQPDVTIGQTQQSSHRSALVER
jgi:hypothetical protein